MQIRENVSLKPFNTFGIDAMARYFLPITNHQSLITNHQSLTSKIQSLILGGGSNLLFTSVFIPNGKFFTSTSWLIM